MYAGLGKWVEVGNSGMFRPEMLLPMGLPREVSVIAWGVSLERYIVHMCMCHSTVVCGVPLCCCVVL